MRAVLPILALALTTAAPALADEIWSTPFGDAIYEADIGDTTIITVPQTDGVMRVYLPGLAGNYDSRGTHTGYWIGNGEGYCPAGLTGIDGTGSRQWGEVILAFDYAAYPTGWTLVVGDCFAPPYWTIRGEARTGG